MIIKNPWSGDDYNTDTFEKKNIMKFDSKKIDQEFKEYYSKNITTATHVFIHSETQIIERGMCSSSFFQLNTINGKPYTEMRSRDAQQEYIDDAIFVAVGTYNDVNK